MVNYLKYRRKVFNCTDRDSYSTEEEIKDVIETYYLFPDKGITIDMLKAARLFSGLPLSECRWILTNYIKDTYEILL